MKTKEKMKRYIVVLFLLASITGLIGLMLYARAGQVKTVKLNYDETASVHYKVFLNDNNNYEKKVLDEGMQYITSIIKKIDINYKYQIKYSERVNLTFKNNVDANVKIVDVTNNSKVIYEKNEKLSTKTVEKRDANIITENKTITIDYQKYNRFANEFKTKHSIPADCKLIITFTTTQNNTTDFVDNIKRSKVMMVEIPLAEKMITINKSSNSRDKSFYIASSTVPFSNVAFSMISYILFGLTILFVLLGIYLNIKKNKLMGEYERFVEKTLKQYDAYISESSGEVELKEDVVFVKSFKELLDVRNNVDKAIIFNRVDYDKSRFIIIDGEQDYCYEVNKKDFE